MPTYSWLYSVKRQPNYQRIEEEEFIEVRTAALVKKDLTNAQQKGTDSGWLIVFKQRDVWNIVVEKLYLC